MPAPRGATRHAGERPPAGAAQQARAAHAHGKAGRNAPEWVMADPDHLRAYNNGKATHTAALAASTPSSSSVPADELEAPAAPTDTAPTTNPFPSGGSASGGRLPGIPATGGGVVLGVLAYAVGINYLRGGLPQVKGWFGAKFVNKPAGATSSKNAKPATPAKPGRPG